MLTPNQAKQIRLLSSQNKLASEIADEVSISYKNVQKILSGRRRSRRHITKQEIQDMKLQKKLGKTVADISEDFKLAPATVRKYLHPNIKKHQLLAPDGTLHEFSNIAEFSRTHDISTSAIHRLIREEIKSTRKGWQLPS